MKNTLYIFLAVVLTATACQNGSDLETKKKELEASKKQLAELKAKITSLEKEIQESDTAALRQRNAVLVSAFEVQNKPFEHFVELRGTVESRRNVQLSSSIGGKIESVNVKEGQRVAKGQALVILDADIIRNNIAELETQLELAATAFERQDRLWKQKIGTEMQYLQAKNQKESLEKRLATTRSQLDDMIIRAPFNGTIDRVEALQGQIATPGSPLVRIVNPDDTYVRVDVSENYIGKFKTGDKVEVHFVAQDKKIQSTVKSVGQVINPENRTFDVEVSLPATFNAKPNQIAIVTLKDYSNPEAISVPTSLIQRDNKGQYVYVVEKSDTATVAKRTYVETGSSYKSLTEVVKGLNPSDVVVNEGYREVTDGVEIMISQANDTSVAKK